MEHSAWSIVPVVNLWRKSLTLAIMVLFLYSYQCTQHLPASLPTHCLPDFMTVLHGTLSYQYYWYKHNHRYINIYVSNISISRSESFPAHYYGDIVLYIVNTATTITILLLPSLPPCYCRPPPLTPNFQLNSLHLLTRLPVEYHNQNKCLSYDTLIHSYI